MDTILNYDFTECKIEHSYKFYQLRILLKNAIWTTLIGFYTEEELITYCSKLLDSPKKDKRISLVLDCLVLYIKKRQDYVSRNN